SPAGEKLGPGRRDSRFVGGAGHRAGRHAPGRALAEKVRRATMTDTWFPLPPAKPPEQLHPLALAYIGDAIFEVYVRQYLLAGQNHRPHHLHKEATRYVAAKAQARLLADWMPDLAEDERDVVRRGMGAKSGTAPK